VGELVEALRRKGIAAQGYHGDMGEEEKAEADRIWRTTGCSWMIATSAFSAGVHYDHVRYVLHMYGLSCIPDYHQETGRAGRDGEPAEAITFTMEVGNSYAISNDPQTQRCDDYLKNNTTCRRKRLHDLMDGPWTSKRSHLKEFCTCTDLTYSGFGSS
jgi:superfamily II DNA helicase RecQ